MAVLYKCKVVNCWSLNVRSGPSMSNPAVQWLQAGDIIIVDGESNGWYKLQNTTRYAYSKYLQVIENLAAVSNPAPQPTPSVVVDPDPNKSNGIELPTVDVGGTPVKIPLTDGSGITGHVNIDNFNGSDDDMHNISTSKTDITTLENKTAPYGIFYMHTNGAYPKNASKTSTKGGTITQYNDWYMNHNIGNGYSNSLISMFQKIQENMDIPSFYSREDINKNLHINFNRFRREFPDVYLKNTMSVVIFTRPDLNLYNTKFEKNDMVSSHPRSNLIMNKNDMVARLLTSRCTGGESHKFNPLLSNMAQSLEVMDDVIDTLETGETFTGYKMQYSKHNIRSITSGSFSVKYKETFDLAITDTHQLWVDYMSNVYRGIFEPKREYIWKKELDYACNVYYFLLDQDGETIKFWSKYYGVFPNNVPKSVYSFDFGSQVSFPELSVTYSYIYKEDLSPVALIEFNKNAGVSNGSNSTYVKPYVSSLGHSGKTWVGTPFIYSYNYKNGLSTQNVQGFKLGWKQRK